MRSILLAALSVLLCTLSLAQQDPTVKLTVIQPSVGTFLSTVDVTVHWELDGGNYDPVKDYVSAWWAPFAPTYTEYHNVTANKGSATFTLLNARHAFFFRYYRMDTLLAQSESVVPEASYPMQIHTTFVPQHPDRVRVIWNTNRTTGTEIVYWGTDPSNLNQQAYAFHNATYSHHDLNEKVSYLGHIPILDRAFHDLGSRNLRCVFGTCYNDSTASLLFVDPGVFHYADMTGLSGGTTYYYQVGESDGYLSDVRPVTSRVPAGAGNTIQILYVADAGAGKTQGGYSGSASHNACPIGVNVADGADQVWEAILKDPLHASDQASIMNGDISYARGWPWVWELFHEETKDIFGPAPVMASFGNHEFDYGMNPFTSLQNGDSGGEAGIPTAQRFGLDWGKSWYHMAMGPVHLFALSSEQSIEEQAQWLAEEFPKVDRTATPFLIVFLHRPIHMSSTWIDHYLQGQMELYYTDMFSQYGVDMVLTGHAHYYERTCPINSGECNNYGYRPVWTRHANKTLSYNQCTHRDDKRWHVDLQSCKVTCMYKQSCTGAYINDEGKCMLIECPQPFTFQSADHDTYELTRASGNPPVYIVDGTAGGVHVPNSSPNNKITIYKDFDKWGYSRITANATAMTWTHYHIDGSVVDQVTLAPVNV